MKIENKATCLFIYKQKIFKNDGEFNFHTITHKIFGKSDQKHQRYVEISKKIKEAKKLFQSLKYASLG